MVGDIKRPTARMVAAVDAGVTSDTCPPKKKFNRKSAMIKAACCSELDIRATLNRYSAKSLTMRNALSRQGLSLDEWTEGTCMRNSADDVRRFTSLSSSCVNTETPDPSPTVGVLVRLSVMHFGDAPGVPMLAANWNLKPAPKPVVTTRLVAKASAAVTREGVWLSTSESVRPVIVTHPSAPEAASAPSTVVSDTRGIVVKAGGALKLMPVPRGSGARMKVTAIADAPNPPPLIKASDNISAGVHKGATAGIVDSAVSSSTTITLSPPNKAARKIGAVADVVVSVVEEIVVALSGFAPPPPADLLLSAALRDFSSAWKRVSANLSATRSDSSCAFVVASSFFPATSARA